MFTGADALGGDNQIQSRESSESIRATWAYLGGRRMRANYSEDLDQWDLIRWRGAVASAIRGKRGQAFLQEILASLDAIPHRRLIAGQLIVELLDGEDVCTIGAVGYTRKLKLAHLDPEDSESIARIFGITEALTREIEYINDENGPSHETPEQRWFRMRAWVAEQVVSA